MNKYPSRIKLEENIPGQESFSHKFFYFSILTQIDITISILVKAKFVAIQNIENTKMMDYKNEEMKINFEQTKKT
jgi:hypothetical protein